MTTIEPTAVELARIDKIAQKCFGFILNDAWLKEAWNIANFGSDGYSITKAPYPLTTVIRLIANAHADTWPLVKGEL